MNETVIRRRLWSAIAAVAFDLRRFGVSIRVAAERLPAMTEKQACAPQGHGQEMTREPVRARSDRRWT
jgi:hypothetical protein